MAESHVLTALKAKRARIAGEIRQAQDVISKRSVELATIDAVILMFSPDCDPDMIAPIRPSSHGLFFRYRELSRLCRGIMRRAKGPTTLENIAGQVMDANGLPDDRRLRKHVTDTTRQGLTRIEKKRAVRR